MDKRRPFSLSERLGSFRFAFAGLIDVLRTEHSAWIHFAITVLVLFFSWWLELDGLRWCLIIFAIMSVWVSESFNTVFEILANMVSPSYSASARRAKDIAAAAVLISSLTAAIVGGIILGAPLWQRLNQILR